MKDRILNIMKQENMNQQEFSKALGISPASVSSIFNGRTSPTIKHAEALHKYFPKLRLNWLLFGEGEMYDHSSDEETADAGSANGLSNADNNGLGDASQGSLFDGAALDSMFPGRTTGYGNDGHNASQGLAAAQPVIQEVVKYVDKPPRKIVEIRIFFDDGTFETFSR